MSNCFGWKGVDGNGTSVYFIACATSPSWTVNPIYPGNNYSYPSQNGTNLTGIDGYGATPGNIIAINSNSSLISWLGGATATGNCNACLATSDGDCPEGQCKCSSNSYPGYCCLDSSIAAQISQLTSQVKSINH